MNQASVNPGTATALYLHQLAFLLCAVIPFSYIVLFKHLYLQLNQYRRDTKKMEGNAY